VAVPWDKTVLERFERELDSRRDPARVEAMERYMRNQFSYAGVASPGVDAAVKASIAGLDPPSERQLLAFADKAWRKREREFQYAAGGLLRRYASQLSSSALPAVHRYTTTKSWWDTVDLLAIHVTGPLVRADPGLVVEMDRWIESENIWVARTAILHQNAWKTATDEARLFRYCLARAAEREFFIRKAIGWALREYSKTSGDAVREFIAANEHLLSPLSRREGLAWLDR
jgi:3-methyladenine DNA glycosylase AlkD